MQIDYKRKMYWEVLGWLTLAYFIVEVLINYIVFKQMSVKSDFFAIEATEFWGKIITGVGAGLVLSKTFYALKVNIIGGNPKILYGTEAVKVLLLSFLVCIPLSFYLQDKLINEVVERSTAEQRNKATLVMATQATMKPHYNPTDIGDDKPDAVQKLSLPITRYKSSFREDYTKEQNLLFHASKACVKPSSEKLEVKLNIDKAFFAFNAFKEPLKESLYKQVITDYYSCVLDNAEYQAAKLPEPEFDDTPFRKLYAQYEKESKRYNEAMTRASKSVWSNMAKRKVDKKWKEGVVEFLGSSERSSWLTPNLSYKDFVKNYAIQKYMYDRAKDDEKDLIPYNRNFIKAAHKRMVVPMKDMLPNTAIPTYIEEGAEEPLGNLIKYRESYDGERINVTQEQVDRVGKQAYKGIIMPIVALGASLTFLLLNLVIIMANFLARKITKRLSLTNPPLGLNLLLGLIMMVVLSYAPSFINNNDNDIANRTLVIKMIYYYERSLSGLLGLSEKNVEDEQFALEGDKEKDFNKYIQ